MPFLTKEVLGCLCYLPQCIHVHIWCYICVTYLLMDGECNKGEKFDSLLRCSVNKCFDGYKRVDDHSWKAKHYILLTTKSK